MKDETQTVKINGKEFKIKAKQKGITLNGARINREDVFTALYQALFLKPESHDEFLKELSRIPVKVQKLISEGGIEYELEIGETSDNCFSQNEKISLAMPITRKGNEIWTIINGKEFRIKNMQSLFKLQDKSYYETYGVREGQLQKTIRQLYKTIKGITPEDIGFLIKEGKELHRQLVAKRNAEMHERIEKSKEFIRHAVKLTKAKKVRNGYEVKGMSGTIYKVTDDARTYLKSLKRGEEDEYLCIVDSRTRTNTEEGKNDAIAKRLLMLSKDRKIADEVWAVGDRMDAHWDDIRYEEDREEYEEDEDE